MENQETAQTKSAARALDPIVLDKDGNTLFEGAAKSESDESYRFEQTSQNPQFKFRQFNMPSTGVSGLIFRLLPIVVVPLVVMVAILSVVLMPLLLMVLKKKQGRRAGGVQSWVIRRGGFKF